MSTRPRWVGGGLCLPADPALTGARRRPPDWNGDGVRRLRPNRWVQARPSSLRSRRFGSQGESLHGLTSRHVLGEEAVHG